LPADVKRPAAPTCRSHQGIDPAFSYNLKNGAHPEPVNGRENQEFAGCRYSDHYGTLGRWEAEVCEEQNKGGSAKRTAH
jgi:hypothetical protein